MAKAARDLGSFAIFDSLFDGSDASSGVALLRRSQKQTQQNVVTEIFQSFNNFLILFKKWFLIFKAFDLYNFFTECYWSIYLKNYPIIFHKK